MATVRGAQPPTERPFFRYDLETVQVVEGDNRFVDVSDPTTGKRFRFYEVEYAVACGMDGQRDLAGLSAWAKDELGLDTDPDELRGVVDTLAELGYLGAPAAPVERLGRQEKPTAPGGAVEGAPAAARPTPVPPVEGDVALGSAGKSPLEREGRQSLPESDDIELGFAGAPAEPAEPALAESVDIELGFAGASARSETEPSGPPERVPRMSTNLGDHMDVGAEDVKEAVRQSRVMAAVDPEELELEAEEPELPAAVDTHSRETVRMPEADAKTLAAEAAALGAAGGEEAAFLAKQLAEADDGTAAATQPGKRKAAMLKKAEVASAETPAEPEKAEPRKAKDEPAKKAEAVPAAAVEPEREKRRSAGLVLWLLLLGVAAAGAWYYYTEFVAEREPAPPVQPKVPKEAEVVPKKAPPPTAVLAAGEAPSAEAVTAQAGAVAWIATAGTEVAADDVVAKLAGFEKLERARSEDEASRDRYQRRLDEATARGNKRQMARHQADMDRKTRDIAQVQAKLDPFLVKAPVAGVIEPMVEVGAKVESGAPVVKVTGEAGPTAEFSVPTGRYEEGDEVEVAAADDAGLTATCTVAGTAPGKIRVECPVDSGLGDGVAIVLPAQD